MTEALNMILNDSTYTLRNERRISQERSHNIRAHLLPIVGSVALVGAFAPVAAHLIDVNQHPIEYAPDTTSHVATSGESPWSIAEEVPGSDTVPLDVLTSHIMQDPANIAVLKDGLQPGEQLVVPTHVTHR